MKFLNKNNKGSILAMTMMVLLIVVVLGIAVLGIAQFSYQGSVRDYSSQQAFYSARSAVLATTEYFIKNPSQIDSVCYNWNEAPADWIKAVQDSPEAGKVTVTVLDWGAYMYEKTGDSKYKPGISYKITATAVFNGVERSVHTLLERGAASKYSPFAGALTLTGLADQPFSFGNGSAAQAYVGDVYISAPPSGNPIKIVGNLGVKGNVYLNGDVQQTGNNFHVYARTEEEGGDPSSPYNGALFVNGALRIWDGAFAAEGEAYCETLSPGSNYTSTPVHTGGVPGNHGMNFDINQFKDKPDESDVYDPPVTIPPRTGTPYVDSGDSWSVGTRTISANCTLRPSDFDCLGGWSNNKQIIFDTTHGDLHIYLEPGTYTLSSGEVHPYPLRIEGAGKVYFYGMESDENSPGITWRVDAASGTHIIGDPSAIEDASDYKPPRMYLYSKSKNSVIQTVNAPAPVAMYIFMPYGLLKPEVETHFYGSVVTSGMNTTAVPQFIHIKESDGDSDSEESSTTGKLGMTGIVAGTGELPDTTTP